MRIKHLVLGLKRKDQVTKEDIEMANTTEFTKEESGYREVPVDCPISGSAPHIQVHEHVESPMILVEDRGSLIRSFPTSTLVPSNAGSAASVYYLDEANRPPIESHLSTKRKMCLKKQMSEDVSRDMRLKVNSGMFLGSKRTLRSFRGTSYESDVMPSSTTRPWARAPVSGPLDSPVNLSSTMTVYRDSIGSIREEQEQAKSRTQNIDC